MRFQSALPGRPTRQPGTDGPVYGSFLGISDKGSPMNKSHLIDQLTEATPAISRIEDASLGRLDRLSADQTAAVTDTGEDYGYSG